MKPKDADIGSTMIESGFRMLNMLMQDDKCGFRWGLRPKGGCSRSCGGGTQVVKKALEEIYRILGLIERLVLNYDFICK